MSLQLPVYAAGKDADGDPTRTLHVAGNFSRLTYYNHDVPPSQDDKLPKALEWLALARVMHAPVSRDEFLAILGQEKQME